MKILNTIIITMFALNIATAQWIKQVSGTSENLHSVYFINDDVGFVAGDNGTILKTTDGGLNWQSQNVSSVYFSSIFFPDQNTGYAAGSK